MFVYLLGYHRLWFETRAPGSPKDDTTLYVTDSLAGGFSFFISHKASQLKGLKQKNVCVCECVCHVCANIRGGRFLCVSSLAICIFECRLCTTRRRSPVGTYKTKYLKNMRRKKIICVSHTQIRISFENIFHASHITTTRRVATVTVSIVLALTTTTTTMMLSIVGHLHLSADDERRASVRLHT